MHKKLGMIGLGKMGFALSRQMMQDGHELYGFDIDPVKNAMFRDMGGTTCDSSADVAKHCSITFSSLLKPEHIESNTLGEAGIVHTKNEGHIHVETSTMHPTFQKGLASKLGLQGIEMLDAPISGSHDKVETRQILFMVGGKQTIFDQVRPILDSLSAHTTYTGPSGSGAAMKVVTNMFVNSVFALFAEMILVGEKCGLSHEVMKDCLSKGSVQGSMLEDTSPRIFARDFEPRGAVEIFVKDMGIAIDLAHEHGIELQVIPAARKMFQRAEAAGWGKFDAGRVIEVYEGKDEH